MALNTVWAVDPSPSLRGAP